ncbi:MAG TPA: Coq4 family protein [Hyphomonadaceae bacterium]|nr:Coq4 family protein [Hyphomonadaceae bacterium]
MISDAIKQRYQALVASGEGDPAVLARAAKQGDAQAALDLGALLTRCGWAEPALAIDAYDAAARGWFSETSSPFDLRAGTGKVPPALWAPFWKLMDDDTRMDAGGFTMRVAQLGGIVEDSYAERAGEASLAIPGVPDAVAQGWPPKFRMADLAACPHDSLGGEFHRQIIDNNFDLEVLDRDTLGLASMRPPLDYLNARALQCHDIWHIVGGYHTTALHEVAISAFQLSQFGHNYSAQFLAVVVTKAAIKRPEGLSLLLDIILTGWRHGRETPSLMGVDWPAIWAAPLDRVRERLGVSAYRSPYPADLVEQLERMQAAAVAS